jgi:DNA-directed RNA polymerase specialized sigma24 family protein
MQGARPSLARCIEAPRHRPALEQLRSRYSFKRRFAETPAESLADARAGDPFALVVGAELAEQLRLALVDLEPIAAEIFCLACLDGWGYDEIGAQWGMTANHVGVLLSRTRAALRKRLHAFHPRATTEGVS